jgi:hypothetical protein
MTRPFGQLPTSAAKEFSMADVTSRNLQARLLILVFLAFIPAMGLFWYANRELRSLQMEAKEQELAQRAYVAATEYRSLMDQSQAFLAALAEFPEVRDARFATCTDYLSRVLQHADQYTTISIIGMDGYLACGGITPENLLYLGDRAYFVRATTRKLFSVGEFTLGRITGKPVVGVAHPLLDEEEVTGILGASLDLNVLADTHGEGPLPEGYTFTVLDRNRRVLVRRPLTGDFTMADSVGAIADESFPALPESSTPVLEVGTDLDGMERLFAAAALRGPAGATEGYVAFGRTRVTLMEEVDELVSLQLRFLAVMGLVLLALAWVLGHFWLVRGPPPPEEA